MEHAFGSGEDYSVGVEEELLLVDSESHALADRAESVLGAMQVGPDAAGHEAFAAELELRSPPSATGAGAAEALERGRRAAARAAAGAGADLLAAGIHPAGRHGDARLVELERYRQTRREMRGLIQRTPECALHVHVGMPDPDAAIRAFNGLRAWLPLLRGLAASSPFWFGTDSGLASARWALVRPYPGRGIPRALRDFADYEAVLASVAASGGPADYGLLWWDVRPHPRLGTVEVREMDSQPRLADVAALAALIRGLAVHEAGARGEPATSEAIEWSGFRAARDGIEATILHEERLVPLPEVARAAVEVARPAARGAGDEEALDGIERILEVGGSARLQRAAFAKGGMRAVVSGLIGETAAGYDEGR